MRKRILRFIVLFLILAISLAGLKGYHYYKIIFKSNVDLGSRSEVFFYIPTNTSYQELKVLLFNQSIIEDSSSFDWVARKKNLPNHVNAGKYLIKNHISNQVLVNLIRSGNQTPIKLTFNLIRTKADLAGKVSRQIEADSISILELLNSKSFLQKSNLNKESSILICIPNTYEMYWNTSAEKFFKRMHQEYKAFWNETRLAKARDIGLTPTEVGILASISQEEIRHNDELARVSGVYVNRVKKGMKLQADPTVKFALGDFEIKRVLNKDKEVDSPYNTYMYAGIPPGPICLPNIHALNSVLNYEKHNYLFFCANEDFSGYHRFSKSYSQHRINARKYQQELSRKNIKR